MTSDPKKAVALYTKACDGNYEPGCYYLGRMYATGRGVAMDAVKAKALFKRACDKGVAAACKEEAAPPATKPTMTKPPTTTPPKKK